MSCVAGCLCVQWVYMCTSVPNYIWVCVSVDVSVCVWVCRHPCAAYQSLCWLHCFATLSWQISFKYSPLFLSHAHTSTEAWKRHTPCGWTLHAEGCQLWSASPLTLHPPSLLHLLYSLYPAPSSLPQFPSLSDRSWSSIAFFLFWIRHLRKNLACGRK